MNGYGNYGFCERSCPVVRRSLIRVRNGAEEDEEEKGEAPA